ncbi:hypothetical protein IZ6_25520 [Terrihabitans soli]|uniref:Uncharacterized protein n=1 Tax=Terrihabitans soli TaxID=708113 RepID=A0A6S6QV67_9HYPH|nr:hypothetical protein [Terrihabitans soli]BCJ91817.1 hypothetical protein IZ6_25520 [Terrihabitans soli]
MSVGYFNHHTSKECQDIVFLKNLRDRLIKLDISELVSHRKAGEVEWLHRYESNGTSSYGRIRAFRGWDSWEDDLQGEAALTEAEILVRIIKDHPEEIACFLEEYGVSPTELREAVYKYGGVIPR